MRGVSKKMFISILTSVIVFVTMVATTFAWVGIFTYANTENFSINLKAQDLDVNYYLTISATGEKNSFSDVADLTEIERQILINQNKWNYDTLKNLDSTKVSSLYSRNCIVSPSSCTINDNNISDFYSLNVNTTSYYETKKTDVMYLKFDIFLSVGAKEGIQPESEINSNVFLTNISETLKGTICQQKLINMNPYREMPSIPNAYNTLLSLPDSNFFNIDSKNATRFALCLYEPIDIEKTYSNEKPIKTFIYQGGTQLPSFSDDVYNLGGNLPEDYNTALHELLIIRPRYKDEGYVDKLEKYNNDLDTAIDRGENDLELNEENSKLWEKPSNIDSNFYLGVHNGIQTKMKVTVYFWFEGWDADCIIGINEKPVSLNLSFTSGVEE